VTNFLVMSCLQKKSHRLLEMRRSAGQVRLRVFSRARGASDEAEGDLLCHCRLAITAAQPEYTTHALREPDSWALTSKKIELSFSPL
jgi:hypothetical protein